MRFSHVYVENKARQYPLTEEILKKTGDAHVIPIEHYKDIFDRPRQDTGAQKKAPALILAVREGARIFKGAPVCQSFGQRNFYYSSSMMNCLFDCEYCYLRGMYPSSNIVVFVNFEDYANDVKEFLKDGPLYVCASYDTDLIALNGLTGLSDRWTALAEENKDLLVELRTKAAPPDLKNVPNVIYAFTLSPAEIAAKYEKNVPSVDARIKAASRALDNGCKVRLCFDPMILTDNWEEIYGRFAESVARQIDLSRLTDVSVGCFRISKEYLSSMRKRCLDSEIAWYPYVIRNGVAQYEDDTDKKMQEFMRAELARHIAEEKIFTWN
ncbi:MAG: radical SAM protein [Ruminococcaceae bacterium]|nr:radical SAM protein [Oscillospiraceae bacterium]